MAGSIERRRPYSRLVIGSGWFLVGAPWDCSGSGRGEAQAPGALRMAGLVDRVDVDLGDAATVIGSRRRDETTGCGLCPTPSPRPMLWREHYGQAWELITGGGHWSSAATAVCSLVCSPTLVLCSATRHHGAAAVVVMAAPAGVSLAIDETAGTAVLRAAWRGHASCDYATTARSAWSGRRKAARAGLRLINHLRGRQSGRRQCHPQLVRRHWRL